MFRFHWNHHQALLQKYIDPLHKLAKMRYGIPYAHTEPVYSTCVFVFLLLDLYTCFRIKNFKKLR